MDSRKWFSENKTWIFVALVILVLSPVVTDILPEKKISVITKVFLILGEIAITAVAVNAERGRQISQQRAEEYREAATEQAARQVELLRDRGILLQRVSEEVRELLSEVRNALRLVQTIDDKASYDAVRQNCIKQTLKSLCKVLEFDSKAPPDNPLKAIYFKATIFEVSADGTRLDRQYWHYPDTIQPRTDSWSIAGDPNSGAVQAYTLRQEVVMSRVKDAAEDGKIWKDAWPGQHAKYAESSMICVPIWRDSTTDVQTVVRSIMTLDTNQMGYFREGEDETAFRNQVFAPFLGVIRLVYTLTDVLGSQTSSTQSVTQEGDSDGEIPK